MTGKEKPPTWVAIGAYELKRSYQLNMTISLLGLLTAITIAATAMVFVGRSAQHVIVEPGTWPVWQDSGKTTISAPPGVGDAVEGGPVENVPSEMDNRLAMPVDDNLLDSESRILSKLEREHLVAARGGGGRPGGTGRIFEPPETPAKAVDFNSVQVLPVLKKSVNPIYPKMARRSGMEGTVTVAVLVGVDGRVRNAQIVKESGLDAGFEEAALAAALETTWEPALQNDRPVEVWVTYKISFKLR